MGTCTYFSLIDNDDKKLSYYEANTLGNILLYEIEMADRSGGVEYDVQVYIGHLHEV